MLANDLRLSTGAMTNRLDRLEKAGLIRRLPDPNDRRGTLIEPTEAGHAAWEGTLRLVTYVTAELDAEMAGDPFLPEVGWSWLTDALDHNGAHYKAAAGTVTRAGAGAAARTVVAGRVVLVVTQAEEPDKPQDQQAHVENAEADHENPPLRGHALMVTRQGCGLPVPEPS